MSFLVHARVDPGLFKVGVYVAGSVAYLTTPLITADHPILGFTALTAGPVIVAGWLFGARVGLLAGLTAPIISALVLFPSLSIAPLELLMSPWLLVHLAYPLVGLAVGRLSNPEQFDRYRNRGTDRSAQLTEALLGLMSDPLVRLDSYGVVLETHGVANFETGRPLVAHLGPKGANDLRRAMERAKADPGVVQSLSFTWRTTTFEARLTKTPNGDFLLVTRDITMRIANQQALRDATRHADAASAAKASFLKATRYRLRSPLTAVLGYADLLQNGHAGPLTDAQLDHVERIIESGNELSAMITELLNMASLESGTFRPDLETLDVEAVVQDVMRKLRPLAQRKSQQLELQLLEGTANVVADRHHLGQALEYLVTNSMSFTEPGGRIRVRVTECEQDVAIDVSDDGPGHAEDDLGRLFLAFEEVGETSSGFRLGLAMSKALVEAQGGRVSAHSEPGRGTTLSVRLPRDQPGWLANL